MFHALREPVNGEKADRFAFERRCSPGLELRINCNAGCAFMSMGNNPGKVDHVVMMVWPENLEAAVERLSQMLEIEFEFFVAPGQGIRGALAAEAMLEFIAPLRDGSGSSAPEATARRPETTAVRRVRSSPPTAPSARRPSPESCRYRSARRR